MEEYNCIVKECQRCGLSRGMRTRDVVCDGCSNKLYRLLCRREEEIKTLKEKVSELEDEIENYEWAEYGEDL